MQINVKTWISIWLKIIFEIKHASHSLPSASQSYSNYPTIGILVLLSWIPASKDFVNKVANTGNRITSLIENKNVLVLNSTTCITSWKRLPAEQRSLGGRQQRRGGMMAFIELRDRSSLKGKSKSWPRQFLSTKLLVKISEAYHSFLSLI